MPVSRDDEVVIRQKSWNHVSSVEEPQFSISGPVFTEGHGTLHIRYRFSLYDEGGGSYLDIVERHADSWLARNQEFRACDGVIRKNTKDVGGQIVIYGFALDVRMVTNIDVMTEAVHERD